MHGTCLTIVLGFGTGLVRGEHAFLDLSRPSSPPRLWHILLPLGGYLPLGQISGEVDWLLVLCLKTLGIETTHNQY